MNETDVESIEGLLHGLEFPCSTRNGSLPIPGQQPNQPCSNPAEWLDTLKCPVHGRLLREHCDPHKQMLLDPAQQQRRICLLCHSVGAVNRVVLVSSERL